MTQAELYVWLEENTRNIFGYAMTRTGNRYHAEELASEICCAILQSSHRLPEDNEKCFRYLWQIAHHTWVNTIRHDKMRIPIQELKEDIVDPQCSVEEMLTKNDEIIRLRRELSMLSAGYRQATVLYYMEELSCREIAERMETTTDMVKYYLFRARKMLKEGLDMERTWGERSYHPQAFEIDFWGNRGGVDAMYRIFRERKILGNILLAAYYNSLTMQELSLELGVAVPYLEDEICWLTERGLLTEKRGKYRTGIPICTEEVMGTIDKRLQKRKETFAMAIVDFMNTETGAEILEIIQRCCPAKTSGNILRWQFLLLICHFGLQQIDQDMFRQPELTGSEPYKRCTGGEGFIWGRSMETTNQLNQKQNIYGVFNDYTCTDERGTVTVWNWAVNKEVQMVTPDMIQPIVCTAIDCFQYLPEEWRNRLREQRYEVGEKANCPVYSMAEFEILQSKMEAFMQTIREYHKEILQDSEEIITDMAPSEIKKSASAAGRHIYGLEGLVCLGDVLVKNGWLTPAEEEDCKPGLLIVAHPERCNL